MPLSYLISQRKGGCGVNSCSEGRSGDSASERRSGSGSRRRADGDKDGADGGAATVGGAGGRAGRDQADRYSARDPGRGACYQARVAAQQLGKKPCAWSTSGVQLLFPGCRE